MLLKFAIRFIGVLLLVLILAAIAIHFFFSSELTADLWIILVPIILGVPIFTAVIFTKDEEVNIHSID